MIKEVVERQVPMFTQNESMWDRAIRFVIGALLVYGWYAAFVAGVLGIVALVIGLVLLLTGVVGWCPLYSLFNMNTRLSTR
jgi:hypothetical protein